MFRSTQLFHHFWIIIPCLYRWKWWQVFSFPGSFPRSYLGKSPKVKESPWNPNSTTSSLQPRGISCSVRQRPRCPACPRHRDRRSGRRRRDQARGRGNQQQMAVSCGFRSHGISMISQKTEELFSLPSFVESHIKQQMGISFGLNGDFMIDSLDFMLIESNFHGDFMEIHGDIRKFMRIQWGFNGI